jgi:hypothetical protein
LTFEREGKIGVTPEFVDMSKEILYHKFRVLHIQLYILVHDL